MKLKICAIAAIAGLLFANTLMAQETPTTETKKKKKKTTISISNNGICIDSDDSVAKAKSKEDSKLGESSSKFKATYAMFDIGVNMLNDNTIYTDPTVVSYLNMPAAQRNKNLFDLKPRSSINVNIHPLMVKFRALKTHNQRIYISTGIGLQIYNFRYENDISYTKNPNGIVMDTIQFDKNKLGVCYINVPLMLTGKTRLHKSTWLVYGAGVSMGYRLSAWNKQVSDERGKVKTRGNFDLMDYNTCLTAEFGVEGVIRFFASYQLTSLYDNGIDQKPICVGVRLSGI